MLPLCGRCGCYHLDECPEGVAPAPAPPPMGAVEPPPVFVPMPVDRELVAAARKHGATARELLTLGGRFLAGVVAAVEAIDRDVTRVKRAIAGSAPKRRRRRRSR